MSILIITDKVKLQPASTADAEMLLRLRTDPEVTRFIKRNPVKDVAEMVQFISNINADSNKTIFLTIHTVDGNELMGTMGLKRIDKENGYAEVGYELFPYYQHMGIMSNALTALLTYAAEQGLHNIEAYTHRDNIASRKLLTKLGFKHLEERVDPNNLNNVIYARVHESDEV